MLFCYKVNCQIGPLKCYIARVHILSYSGVYAWVDFPCLWDTTLINSMCSWFNAWNSPAYQLVTWNCINIVTRGIFLKLQLLTLGLIYGLKKFSRVIHCWFGVVLFYSNIPICSGMMNIWWAVCSDMRKVFYLALSINNATLCHKQFLINKEGFKWAQAHIKAMKIE